MEAILSSIFVPFQVALGLLVFFAAAGGVGCCVMMLMGIPLSEWFADPLTTLHQQRQKFIDDMNSVGKDR